MEYTAKACWDKEKIRKDRWECSEHPSGQEKILKLQQGVLIVGIITKAKQMPVAD